MLSPNNALLLLPPTGTICRRMNFGALLPKEQEMGMPNFQLRVGRQKQYVKTFQIIARQLLPSGTLVNPQNGQNWAYSNLP